jgi:hypothetical protein
VFSAQTEDGELLQSMEDMEDPITFEIGASGVMGNPLFLAFDKAVRGMVVGDQAVVSASGGEYDPKLLFKVPTSHPEVARLREELDQPGKGGLHPGATVRDRLDSTDSPPLPSRATLLDRAFFHVIEYCVHVITH